MSRKSKPKLNANMITSKGQAVPSINKTKVCGTNNKVAVTVRLDEKLYKRMKYFGVDHKMTNQQILADSLLLYLDQNE